MPCAVFWQLSRQPSAHKDHGYSKSGPDLSPQPAAFTCINNKLLMSSEDGEVIAHIVEGQAPCKPLAFFA